MARGFSKSAQNKLFSLVDEMKRDFTINKCDSIYFIMYSEDVIEASDADRKANAGKPDTPERNDARNKIEALCANDVSLEIKDIMDNNKQYNPSSGTNLYLIGASAGATVLLFVAEALTMWNVHISGMYLHAPDPIVKRETFMIRDVSVQLVWNLWDPVIPHEYGLKLYRQIHPNAKVVLHTYPGDTHEPITKDIVQYIKRC